MHAMINYTKNYVSLIYQSLVAVALKSWAQEKTGGVRITYKHLYRRLWSKPPKFEWRNVTSIKFLKPFFSRCFVLIARPRVRTRTYPIEMHACEEYLLFIYCYYVIAFSVLLQAKLTTHLQTEINRR